METLTRCDVCQSELTAAVDSENNICRCSNCGYVFDNPRPTADEIETFYSRATQYDGWLAEESERERLWQRRLKAVRRHKKSGRLLDVGTGTGQFLRQAAKYFTVAGTEVSSSAVRIAREKYGLHITKGGAGDVSVDGGFDVITLFHVLEHVPSPSAMIRECVALLAEDGVLVVAVPSDVVSAKAFAKRAFAFLGFRRFKSKRCGLPRAALNGTTCEIHLSHFTPKTLLRLFRQNALQVLDLGLDPYYVAIGTQKLAHQVWFLVHSVLWGILGVHVYDTILVTARRRKLRLVGTRRET